VPLPQPATRPGPAAASALQLERETGIRALQSERLSGHTTLRVGGPADLLAVASSADDLASLVRFARAAGISCVVFGRGSNVVVADAGFRGLVVLNRAEHARVDGNRLIAESGLPIARAATIALEAGLTGLEFGLAIPGTVGGAVWANAGAHGSDVAAVLESATLLRADGIVAGETVEALGLSYRDSRLKRSGGLGAAADVVLEATFRLEFGDPAAITARLDEIRTWRREHQPLSQPSAGSVFRNPAGDSAGRLIDECGLKGRRLGGAQVSDKHANFIVNAGAATASDIRALADEVRSQVSRRFGVELEYEVQFVGDWS
jgi:UDP-N-acetylmuramate dehydrogenase